MFIDRDLIDRFYDAVVRPPHKEGPWTVEVSTEKAKAISGKLGISGTLKPSALVSKLLGSVVEAELQASGEGSLERSKSEKDSHSFQFEPIHTPSRQLEQLAIHYLVNMPDRIFIEEDTTREEWRRPEVISRLPRALVFLDLPSQDEAQQKGLPEVRLIPTAAEFENGEIVLIYQDLKFGEWAPPKYPEDAERNKGPEQLRIERSEYWAAFAANFSARTAMVAVENAGKERGRIRWIDFRVPLTDEGDSLHLHICPSEKYDTGSFAYNLIARGFKHGLRLVGTLKSEPDMNVLAIYEK